MQVVLADARKARQEILDTATEGADEIKGLLDAAAEGVGPRPRRDGPQGGQDLNMGPCPRSRSSRKAPRVTEASQIETFRRLESIEPVDDKGVARASIRCARGPFARSISQEPMPNARGNARTILQQALTFHETHARERLSGVRHRGHPVVGVAHERPDGDQDAAPGGRGMRRRRRRAEVGASRGAAISRVAAAITRSGERIWRSGPGRLRRLWLEWSTGRDIDDPIGARATTWRVAVSCDERGHPIRGSRTRACSANDLEDVWRPIAFAIDAWLPTRAQGAQGERHDQADQGRRGLVEGNLRGRSRRAVRTHRHARPRRLEPAAPPEQRRSRRRRPRRHRRAASRGAPGDGGRHAGGGARRHEPGRASLAGP